MIPEHLAAPHIAVGELVESRPGLHFEIRLYSHRRRIRSAALETLESCVRGAVHKFLIQAT